MSRHTHSLHSGYSGSLLRLWQSSSCILLKDSLIYPVFVSCHEDVEENIPSLPGQKRLGVRRLVSYLEPLVEKGLRCVLLFGVVDANLKDENGSAADGERSPVCAAVRELRARLPSLIVACDVCLCAYTTAHHCYLSKDDGEMNVEGTVRRLAEIALSYARAGAQIIAPSDMSEGRVRAIKEELSRSGFSRTVSVMSYAAKFASCFYGPFRSAAGSGDGEIDRQTYQLPPGAAGLAIRTAIRDANEGADIIMVKPGLIYLDILACIRRELPYHPLAVFHVSGEYAMLMTAAKEGYINLKRAALEVMLSFRRAGASVIITYLAPILLDMNLQAACP
uniref:Delta-aminolevulinic acid dehydratase n=2 Tax=Schistocephalus solidus TaxID=70667 RepID=A0A0X3NKM4_SCHSO